MRWPTMYAHVTTSTTTKNGTTSNWHYCNQEKNKQTKNRATEGEKCLGIFKGNHRYKYGLTIQHSNTSARIQ